MPREIERKSPAEPEARGPEPSLELGSMDLSALSTRQLLARIAEDVKELVKTEVQLARAELKADLREEAGAAKGLGAAALLGYAGVLLLLVTAVFGLAEVMPAWGAGLLVAGVLLAAGAAAGLLGWRKRVKTPLDRTRRQVTETLEWAKGRAP
jgi:hypothetical protein